MQFSTAKKKGRGFGLAFFFVGFSLWSVLVTAGGPYLHLDSQWLSEPEPLATTIEDWGSEFAKGERQWVTTDLALGVRYKFVDISVRQRALADVRMNGEAAEFYGRIASKEALQVGDSVPVHIKINGFSAQGVRLGYWHEESDWSIAAGVTFLQAKHLMHGTLDGQFAATGADEFSASASVDYFYFRDGIFKRPDITTAEGEGRAFDFSASWSPNDNWDLNIELQDLFAEIRWKDAPYTIAEAHTERKSFDDEGYAVFSPLFSGRQGYREVFHQQLDPRYKLAAAYKRGVWSAHLQGQYQFGYGFAGVGAGYHMQNGIQIKGLIWPELDSVELQFQKEKWQLGLGLDRLSWSEMQALHLTLSYGY